MQQEAFEPESLVGYTLMRRLLLEELVWVGETSAGETALYRARDENLEREVTFQLLLDAEGPRRMTSQLAFRRKGVLLARLAHPNIPRVYEMDIEPETGLHYLIREWIPGRILGDFLHLPVDESQLLRIARDLSSALASAHARDILHREIRPHNVIVEPLRDGSVKASLIEFGLEDPSWGGDWHQLDPLSLAYTAPEILRGGRADTRTDVYALGVLLYQLLTGHLPFLGEPEAVVHGHLEVKPPSIKARAGFDVPPILKALIKRCLEKDPERRFQDGGEVFELASSLLVERAGRQLDSITALAIDPPARYVVIGRAGGAIDIHRTQSGERVAQLDGHRGAEVKAIIFRPETEELLSAGSDGHIHLWSIAERERIGTWPGRRGGLFALAFSPFGYIFASGEADGRIRLWSLLEKKALGELRGHEGPVSALHFLPDGRFLASGGYDGRILLWDIGKMELAESCPWSLGAVRHIAMHVRERFIAAFADGRLALGRWNRPQPAWHRLVHRQPPSRLFEQHGHQGVISVGLDGFVHVIDQFSGEHRRASMQHLEGVRSAVLHPLSETLFASSDSCLLRWGWTPSGDPVLEGFLAPSDTSGWRQLHDTTP